MQLPAPQLTEVLITCPDLKIPLQEHLNTFTEAQRMHVPAAVQEIILGNISAPAQASGLQPAPILASGSDPSHMVIYRVNYSIYF